MPLLSDSEIGIGAPSKKLLSDEELLGPRAPLYLGAGGQALNDAQYKALMTPQPALPSPPWTERIATAIRQPGPRERLQSQ